VETSQTTTDVTVEAKPVEAQPLPAEAQKGSVEQAKPQETPVSPETTPRTYTQDEFERLVQERLESAKGGYEGTLSKLKSDLKAAREESNKIMQERADREDTLMLQKAEDAGQDVDVVRTAIQMRRNAEAEARKATQEREELTALRAELDKAGKAKAASDLVAQYNLGKDALGTLMESNNVVSMENKALKMHVEKLKQVAQPTDTVAPSGGSGQSGVDFSKMSDSQRLGWVIQQWQDSKK